MLSLLHPPAQTLYVDPRYGFVEVVSKGAVHKYLGRAFDGDLRKRGATAIDHQVRIAWMKFRELSGSLTDKKVSITLCLRLFDAAVSASDIYSLDTCPLTMT